MGFTLAAVEARSAVSLCFLYRLFGYSAVCGGAELGNVAGNDIVFTSTAALSGACGPASRVRAETAVD